MYRKLVRKLVISACLPVVQATEARLPVVQATAEMGPDTADSRGAADMLMAAVIGLISLLIWFGGLAVGYWMAQFQRAATVPTRVPRWIETQPRTLSPEPAEPEKTTIEAGMQTDCSVCEECRRYRLELALETSRADRECEQRRQLETEVRTLQNQERATDYLVTAMQGAMKKAVAQELETKVDMQELETKVVNLQLVVERTRKEKRKIQDDNHELREKNHELKRVIDSINAHAGVLEVS